MSNKQLAKDIVKNIGGKGNVVSLTHCVTRLRFVLKDESLAKKAELEKLDIIQVVQQAGQYQVVIGQNVGEVYEDVMDVLGDIKQNPTKNGQKPKVMDQVFEIISGTFAPIIPAIMGSGLLKAVIQMLTMAGWLDAKSGTYAILSATGNAVFYFLPIILGVSFGLKLKVNPYIAATIGAALLEPNFMNLVSSGKKVVDFVGIPVVLMNYSSTVFPIILAVLLLKALDVLLKRYIPKSVQSIVTPMLELILVAPITMMVFGPIGVSIGEWIAKLFAWAMVKNAIISCGLFGAVGIIIVAFGLHWAVIPVIIMNLASQGFDPLLPTVQSTGFAAAGAALGLFILRKNNSKERQNALAAFASAFFAGITEPVIYGIYFKYRKSLIYASIAGMVSGIINGIIQIKATQIAGGIFTIPTFKPAFGYAFSMLVAFGLSLALHLILGVDTKKVQPSQDDKKHIDAKVGQVEQVIAPVSGKTTALSEVKDEVFSSGKMGKGFAVYPTNNNLYAPIAGTVTTVFPTKHAIGITSESGVELLIHIGIDTVNLKGKFFNITVSEGDVVAQGDSLGTVDFTKLVENGYDPTVMVLITNDAKFSKVQEEWQSEDNDSMLSITV